MPPRLAQGSGSGGGAGSSGSGTGNSGRGTVTGGTGTTGTVTTGGGSATETVVELATLDGDSDSVERGDAGVGSATVDGPDDVFAGATPVRG
jgi:hypothetical protein